MSFSKMFEILKIKEKNKIILVQCGHFYIAIGEDAVWLHEKLGLKCTCFKNQMCKVGIPINSIEKYLKELNKLGYAYIVYDYDKSKIELIKKYFSKGKYHYGTDKNQNCIICKGISKYENDEYIEAITKLLEEETKKKFDRKKI